MRRILLAWAALAFAACSSSGTNSPDCSRTCSSDSDCTRGGEVCKIGHCVAPGVDASRCPSDNSATASGSAASSASASSSSSTTSAGSTASSATGSTASSATGSTASSSSTGSTASSSTSTASSTASSTGSTASSTSGSGSGSGSTSGASSSASGSGSDSGSTSSGSGSGSGSTSAGGSTGSGSTTAGPTGTSGTSSGSSTGTTGADACAGRPDRYPCGATAVCVGGQCTDCAATNPFTPSAPVPDSLTPFCSNGSAEISCPSALHNPQDGDLLLNAPSYLVDDGGFTDSTVTDSATGLMWTQRQPFSNSASWNAATAYCDTLTTAGYADWRLPTADELMGLYDYGAGQVSPDFSGINGTELWSSTFCTLGGAAYWVFSPTNGYPECVSASANSQSVLCVRQAACAQPASRFFFAANGNIATDNRTGLTWQRGDNGAKVTLDGAFGYCASLVLDGVSGWRVPTNKELQSIIDYSQPTGTAFDPAIFTSPYFGYLWTSTPVQASPSAGFFQFWVQDKRMSAGNGDSYVRCVR